MQQRRKYGTVFKLYHLTYKLDSVNLIFYSLLLLFCFFYIYFHPFFSFPTDLFDKNVMLFALFTYNCYLYILFL